MSINIGLDIGAVSLKLAAIGSEKDPAVFDSLLQHSSAFFRAELPFVHPYHLRPIVLSHYRRIQGSPIQSTFDLLEEFYQHVPELKIEGIRVTGSGSGLISKILGISSGTCW